MVDSGLCIVVLKKQCKCRSFVDDYMKFNISFFPESRNICIINGLKM